jgi:hypothetical protein
MVLGPSPCDAPRAVVTVMPLLFWNSGRSSSYAAEKPPDMRTLTWAANAAGQRTNIVIARISVGGNCHDLYMWSFPLLRVVSVGPCEA